MAQMAKKFKLRHVALAELVCAAITVYKRTDYTLYSTIKMLKWLKIALQPTNNDLAK